MAADKLLTVPQTAELLACSRWHVYAMISAGKLKTRPIGLGARPITRVLRSSVDAFIRNG
ncbi:AlpA family transcriptional regulator [Modestobacter sp. Leaf380]|uniref:helix-turn-helix transcriptional regulator n=1 Tax=Modestobacter sp. Leaf380 TaxID=1736356 RepID=UPI0006F319CF|nr:helix-turn-helix domain-containing protein [Modestobacter sp. Leaf380]KQS66240.1 hypothetical protein ASG41_13025 [Modestobacter sp. Leaf380]